MSPLYYLGLPVGFDGILCCEKKNELWWCTKSCASMPNVRNVVTKTWMGDCGVWCFRNAFPCIFITQLQRRKIGGGVERRLRFVALPCVKLPIIIYTYSCAKKIFSVQFFIKISKGVITSCFLCEEVVEGKARQKSVIKKIIVNLPVETYTALGTGWVTVLENVV